VVVYGYTSKDRIMADLGINGGVTPVANVKVHRLWTEQQIAECEVAIKRLEVNAEEIIKGKLKGIEASILMHKRKAVMLYAKLDNLEKFGTEDVVNIDGTNVKRLENKGEPNE